VKARGRWFLLTAMRLLRARGFKVTVVYKRGARLLWRKGALRGSAGIVHSTVSLVRLAPFLRGVR
jgi:hypothetical protein